MSILQKVEKLICHEVSARKLGSIAEADAFAAKARQLLLQHRVERTSRLLPDQQSHFDTVSVTAAEAGISSLKTRQEWSERLATGVARAFHCELMLQPGSNTVLFRGRASDRAAAALLYAQLAGGATAACSRAFTNWKQRRERAAKEGGSLPPGTNSAAYSRRWKQSFLLGFAHAICQRFACNHSCLHACQHFAGLVRISDQKQCGAKMPQGRAIGGIDLLYDAVYQGQAHAVAVEVGIGHSCAA